MQFIVVSTFKWDPMMVQVQLPFNLRDASRKYFTQFIQIQRYIPWIRYTNTRKPQQDYEKNLQPRDALWTLAQHRHVNKCMCFLESLNLSRSFDLVLGSVMCMVFGYSKWTQDTIWIQPRNTGAPPYDHHSTFTWMMSTSVEWLPWDYCTCYPPVFYMRCSFIIKLLRP